MNQNRKTQATNAKPPQTAVAPDALRLRLEERQERQEWLLDEALLETFPASDPISPSILK